MREGEHHRDPGNGHGLVGAIRAVVSVLTLSLRRRSLRQLPIWLELRQVRPESRNLHKPGTRLLSENPFLFADGTKAVEHGPPSKQRRATRSASSFSPFPRQPRLPPSPPIIWPSTSYATSSWHSQWHLFITSGMSRGYHTRI